MALYLISNGLVPASGNAQIVVAVNAAGIKTMLQVKTSAYALARIVEWGVSFDASAAATPFKVELVETTYAATVTALTTAEITRTDGNALQGGDPVTDLFPVGTTSTGFTASAEGTPGTVRLLDAPQLVAPTNQFIKQFPLGREPLIKPAQFARIRVTAASAANCYCYMYVEI